MALPLEGIRVLDMTIWQQGTYGAAMLADMGADVIKVEGPDSPDPGRGLQHAEGLPPGVSPYFEAHNRNKRGIVVDAKHAQGRQVLLRLASTTDVFVQNMRKGVAERLGLGYDDLRAVNPRIIYASASGYGDLGPERELPSMDIMAQARGGLMSVVGGPDDPPFSAPVGLADQVGAMWLAYGIMVALFHRERTGEAQAVDCSLLGGQVALQSFNIGVYLASGQPPQRRPRTEAQPLWNMYRCADGRWLVIGLPQGDRWWAGLCAALELDHLADDPRFCSLLARSQNNRELIAVLDERFAGLPATSGCGG